MLSTSHRLVLVFCTSYLIFFSSCHQPSNEKMSDAEIRERMTNVNRILVEDESKEIEEFITRHQWKMLTTGTGLRIDVYEKGNGRQPAAKDIVSIVYTVYLLDGTLCYEADEVHPLRFIIGHGQQTSGLEEGLMMMHEGARAHLVVPSHRAYGMTGDENKIPAGSALYYDVKLVRVGS